MFVFLEFLRMFKQGRVSLSGLSFSKIGIIVTVDVCQPNAWCNLCSDSRTPPDTYRSKHTTKSLVPITESLGLYTTPSTAPCSPYCLQHNLVPVLSMVRHTLQHRRLGGHMLSDWELTESVERSLQNPSCGDPKRSVTGLKRTSELTDSTILDRGLLK